MTTVQPTPPEATQASYWQPPSTTGPDYQILPRLRGVPRRLDSGPRRASHDRAARDAARASWRARPRACSDPYLYDVSQPGEFSGSSSPSWSSSPRSSCPWQLGPSSRIGDLPAIGRLVLGLCFVAVPAAMIVLGAIDAAQLAAVHGQARGCFSSWLKSRLLRDAVLWLAIDRAGRPCRASTVKFDTSLTGDRSRRGHQKSRSVCAGRLLVARCVVSRRTGAASP